MKTAFIAITEYCSLYQVDPSFIRSLEDEGLIHIDVQEEETYIDEEELPRLELYTRWHHELGINPEGIDTVRHLIDRIKEMQAELNEMKSRLRLYEAS